MTSSKEDNNEESIIWEWCDWGLDSDDEDRDDTKSKKKLGEMLTYWKKRLHFIERLAITVDNYWKYTFSITARAKDINHHRFIIELRVGGDHNNIYKFDPFGGWAEWEYAGIEHIKITPDRPCT